MTATRSGNEQSFARFGGSLADAIADPASDLDQDGQTSLLEAFLSFLGLGVQPPMSSWGTMIKDGAELMEEFPWLLVIPAAFFSLTLFSLNFLGDGLRDALDVRTSKD